MKFLKKIASNDEIKTQEYNVIYYNYNDKRVYQKNAEPKRYFLEVVYDVNDISQETQILLQTSQYPMFNKMKVDEGELIDCSKFTYQFDSVGEHTIKFLFDGGKLGNNNNAPLFNANVKNIRIPNNTTIISANAFNGCTSLDTLYIPNSVIEVSNQLFNMGTNDIQYPKHIIYDANTERFNIQPINKGLESIVIGDNVKIINNQSFLNYQNLSSVILGKNINTIELNAFKNCKSLEIIDLPDSLINIGTSAFEFCSSLTSVTIPSGVTYLNQALFSSCIKLNTVNILGDITVIDRAVFSSCIELDSINYNNTISKWNGITKLENWKLDVPSTCIVHCTDGDISITNA